MHTPYKHFERHVEAIKQRLAGAAAAAGAAPAGAAAAAGHFTGQQEARQEQLEEGQGAGAAAQAAPPLYVVCRRGNDSQRAVARLRQLGITHAVDVVGGMEGWAREVDVEFPTY